MRKSILLYLLILTNISLFAQQRKDMTNLLQIELSYYTKPLNDSIKKKFGGYDYPWGFKYVGSLEDGIPILLNKQSTYIKFNKKPMTQYIFFEAHTNQQNAAKALILEELKSHFKFRISDIKDSTDTWMLRKENEKKLLIYDDKENNKQIRGAGASEENEDIWEIIGLPMNSLVYYIELYSKSAIEYLGETKTLYNFKIPLDLLMNFDGLPEYLKKNYGLELTKEKRLIDKKYVEFY